MTPNVARAITRAGTVLAALGAVHSVVNFALLRRPGRLGTAVADVSAVSVLIPARDEADRIGDCLASVSTQTCVAEVIVLDDGSRDATATVARGMGVQVVAGADPPPGWRGKPWACAQLVQVAGSSVLVFLDADVRLAPEAVAAAVGMLDAYGLDVVCPFPRQLAGSLAERLVQPLLVWSWLSLLPLRVAERSSRPSLTAACGQFVVVRRDALARAGGFAGIRGELLDDLALVRAVKASGGRGGVVAGAGLADCRMYDGWAALRDGYGKSLWTAFGSPLGALGVVAGLTLAYVVPAAAMVRGSRMGALGYAAGVASRVVAATVGGTRSWPDSLAHPVSVIVFGGLTLDSLRRHRRGELTWRGRPV